MADVSITAANVLKSSTGETFNGTAGAAITQGQVCYVDTADSNKVKLADANGAAALHVVKGIALNAASTGQPVTLCTKDTAGFTVGGTVTQGVVYALSTTAGGIAPIADLITTGDGVSILGPGLPANKLRLEVQNSGTTVL